MHWARDLPHWSLPDLSRQIGLGGHVWHVQTAGQGPTLLLLHGTGASTHSWRAVIPALAEGFHVVAVDLPGHGFTQSPRYGQRSGLAEMASDLAALMAHQAWQPAAIIGHSAGAAIALQMAKGGITARVVGLNPALRHFSGMAGWLFPMMARGMALTPLLPKIAASRSTRESTERLIRNTGTVLPAEGVGYYARLMADADHVNGALQMMSRWQLRPLLRDLPGITAQALFLAGSLDRASPMRSVKQAAKAMPHAAVHAYEGQGHILQEEAPDAVVAHIRAFMAA